MQIYSYVFILLFFPLSVLCYFIACKFNQRFAAITLLLFNLFFYGYINKKFILFILLSILINYIIANILIKLNNRRKLLLTIGLIFNIGCLFYCKYSNFFVSTLNDIFTLDIMFKNVFVPMGISFFTFQYIALLMDIYRKKVVNINLLDFSVFTTFFPKIVQGPIMLYQDFDEQFNNPDNHKINFENMSAGLYLLSIGFTKKILIADVLANLVNAGYTQYATLNTTMTIIVVVLYSFQIYFDFSGYSDIALGLGKMFNIHYPHNFNSPYKATSIGDFWNRWHISLTNFFTRYLYIPLGGNRKGKTRTLINIMIVFLISGLWHGAAITFIIWGLIHGILSVIDKLIDNPYQRLPHIIKWAITFICVTLAWIYFRSPNLEVANTMISNIFSFNNFNIDYELLKLLLLPEITFIITQYSLEPYTFRFILIFILSIFFATLFTKNTTQIVSEWKPKLSRLLICSFLLCWCILEFGKSAVFLYERF